MEADPHRMVATKWRMWLVEPRRWSRRGRRYRRAGSPARWIVRSAQAGRQESASVKAVYSVCAVEDGQQEVGLTMGSEREGGKLLDEWRRVREAEKKVGRRLAETRPGGRHSREGERVEMVLMVAGVQIRDTKLTLESARCWRCNARKRYTDTFGLAFG